MTENADRNDATRPEQPASPTTGLRPVDPGLSQFPLPMSARRARHEARQARRLRLELPLGHPYRNIPTWMPYGLARIVGHLQAILTR